VLVGPLLAGIHAGDPDRLSLLATFPELRAWERGHESLVRGARAALKAAPTTGGEPLFASLWDGLSGLAQVLEEAIGTDRVWLGTPVTHVGASRSGLEVLAGDRPLQADAVVMAAPAGEAAAVLNSVNPPAAAELGSIPYVSTAVVFLVYPQGSLPDGTGFVVPLGDRTVTACTWLSAKWPRPEHAGRLVLRCFVGRAGAEEALSLSDEALSAAVAGEMREALDLPGEPKLTKVVRWPGAMPQYEVGHLDRLRRIEEALSATPGLFVTGSAYRGVGIADCVRQANDTAQRVLVYLRERKEEAAEKDRRETISWKT
jgi:oxygen-dependent protoporphyrinogen oxidase